MAAREPDREPQGEPPTGPAPAMVAPALLLAWRPFLVALLSVALALTLVVSLEWSHQRASQSLAAMEARDTARIAAETLLRRLIDAETAQRGFLLTGSEAYLRPFTDVERDVDAALQQLNTLYASKPAFLGLVASVASSAQTKLSEMRLTLRWYREGDEAAWRGLLMSDLGRERMESVRHSVDALIDEATAAAQREQTTVQQSLQWGRLVVHFTTLMAVLLLIFFLRKSAALQRAHQEHTDAMAAEHERLEHSVAQRTRELADLNLHLQTLREGERGRLARSLHDELGATLTAAKLDVTRLRRSAEPLLPAMQERLRHLADEIDTGIAIKRRMMEELMPPALHNLGLRTAVEILINEFRSRNPVDVLTDLEQVDADEAGRNALFRVVQESLRNIEQHAQATQVTIRLRASLDHATVEVHDNGVGFGTRLPDGASSAAQPLPASGHSLRQLQYRLELAGGHFNVSTSPGQGTTVRASVPLSATATATATATDSSP
jgi:signal transduction histidine kinase